jgi:4-diphosphocytidyl-2-C-methyl-D-erythritol kinase
LKDFTQKVSAKFITLPAFAKINPYLRVLGKRADGYHEIDTVLQTISLHDTLTFQETGDSRIALWCDDRTIANNEQNLVWRAAQALRQKHSEKRGVRIRLVKRIPAQAGLGGGSSDAAVTLLALADLWQIDMTEIDLREIAGALGADVPFFLCAGLARGTGSGKTVEPLADGWETDLLVLKPNSAVPTAQAYAALNRAALTSSDSKFILSSSPAGGFSGKLNPKGLHNDFEAVVFQLEPEIERARNALLKSGAAAALLAGSGAAVFGVFDNQDAQERAIQAIELETGWRVFPCKTVGRSRYRSAMGPAGGRLARLTGENAGA